MKFVKKKKKKTTLVLADCTVDRKLFQVNLCNLQNSKKPKECCHFCKYTLLHLQCMIADSLWLLIGIFIIIGIRPDDGPCGAVA